MIKTMSEQSFIAEFETRGRMDGWTHNGLAALFNWIEATTPDYDLDVVELCCIYSEFEGETEVMADYDYSYDSLDDLRSALTVIEFDSGFIVGEG